MPPRGSKGLATNIASDSGVPSPEMLDAAGGPHRCHARGCVSNVPRRMFMCGRHWRMVSSALQTEIWRTYRTGQETGAVAPSQEYLAAARSAIESVAKREGRT